MRDSTIRTMHTIIHSLQSRCEFIAIPKSECKDSDWSRDYAVGKWAVRYLDLDRELKKQYTEDEWVIKREEILKKLPAYVHVERLYKEEKLYDRLLAYVLNSPGLYALQEYEKVLKKEYPEQIWGKYKDEVNKMAMHTSDRKHYAHLVSLLRRMQQMKGGMKLVE